MPPRQPPPDPYAVLGLDAGATQDEIRRAYRTLARKHHPDLNRDRPAEAEHAIKKLNAAYDLLRDEKRRAQYDQERRRAAAAASGPSYSGHRPGHEPSPQDGAAWRARRDMEGSFFNRWQERRHGTYQEPPPAPPPKTNARPRPGTQRPTDPGFEDHELHEIRLTFKQAVRGITKSLLVGSQTACGLCDGTGRVDSEPPERCPACRRLGLRSHSLVRGRFVHVCKFCDWSEEGTVRCPGCAGTGTSKGHRIRVAIPPGLRDGARLRHRVPGMSRPVHIVIHVGGSRVFERGVGELDDQLLVNVTIAPEIALVGGKAKVPTIEGSVTVKVPAGLQSGSCMKLSGRGVKRRNGTFGDLIVRFHILSGRSRGKARDSGDDLE